MQEAGGVNNKCKDHETVTILESCTNSKEASVAEDW